MTASLEVVPYGQGFDVDARGLTVHGKPTFEAWSELCHRLKAVEQGIQFALGDAIRLGEELFGERASQIIDASEGWSESTVKVYRWVAERVPFENRRSDLTFAHHLAIAALTPRSQRKWLAQAAGNGDGAWPVSRLKSAVRAGGEQPESHWYLVVECKSPEEQSELQKRLEAEGRPCKPSARRASITA